MTVLLSVQKNSGAIQIDHNVLKKQSLRVSFHLGQSDDNQRLGQTLCAYPVVTRIRLQVDWRNII